VTFQMSDVSLAASCGRPSSPPSTSSRIHFLSSFLIVVSFHENSQSENQLLSPRHQLLNPRVFHLSLDCLKRPCIGRVARQEGAFYYLGPRPTSTTAADLAEVHVVTSARHADLDFSGCMQTPVVRVVEGFEPCVRVRTCKCECV